MKLLLKQLHLQLLIRMLPLGANAIIANILPGDGLATSPAPNIEIVNTPLAPPAITANTNAGFINTYGKYIS